MTTDRKPERDTYDALVDLWPPRALPTHAVAFIKRTFERDSRGWKLAAATPLEGDDRNAKMADPSMRASDFRSEKVATDVLVYGKAFAPNAAPCRSMDVAFALGPLKKTLRVFGDRVLEGPGDRPHFSDPTPFTEMPLDWEHAYGGIDLAAPMTSTELGLAIEGVFHMHPGLYERNPLGKGYFIAQTERYEDEIALPNVEDPSDLLSPTRCFAGSPSNWWTMPLPASFEPTFFGTFPRCLFLGAEPTHVAPLDERLPEVRRGFLNPALINHEGPDAFRMFYQEASSGMILPNARAGTPGGITGMSLDAPTFHFEVPPTPRVDITYDGVRTEVQALLSKLVIFPNENRMTATYAAILKPLSRVLVPGVSVDIPLSVSVDRDRPIPIAPVATAGQ